MADQYLTPGDKTSKVTGDILPCFPNIMHSAIISYITINTLERRVHRCTKDGACDDLDTNINQRQRLSAMVHTSLLTRLPHTILGEIHKINGPHQETLSKL